MNYEHDKVFDMYLRGRNLSVSDRHFLDQLKADGSDAYTAPETFQSGYKKALEQDCVFRRLGTVMTAPEQSGYIEAVTSTGVAEIVNAGESIPEGSDGFSTLTFSSYKLANMCKLSNSFIDDFSFDVGRYLRSDFARRFGRGEEKIFIQGTGTDEPKGILASAQTGAVQVDPDGITYDDMLELYFSIDGDLRKSSSWLMNDSTAMFIQMLKDDSGAYIWKDNNTIFGRPVEISNYMNDDTKPIAFGDFSFFWIIQRTPLTVKTLTELFINSNQTGYIGYERLDGRLIRSDAVKLLVTEEDETETDDEE